MTLDDDVVERVKEVSRSRGNSFRDTLNDLLRVGLLAAARPPSERTFSIRTFAMGVKPGLNYDDIESLLEYSEGEQHR